MSSRHFIAVVSVVVSSALRASSAAAHTQVPRDYRTAAPSVTSLADAEQAPLATALLIAPWLFQTTTPIDVQRAASVCWSDRSECRRIVAVERCEQAQSDQPLQCTAGTLLFRVDHTPVQWRWWQQEQARRRVALQEQQPTPQPVDPCASRTVERTWAAHVVAGPEFAMLATDPRMGFVISPGFRRTMAVDPNRLRYSNDECDAREPSLDSVSHSRLIGTEFGLDFRGHVHWRFADAASVHVMVGVAPIGRLTLGRWRLPSILGALLPEIGYQMFSRRADPMGPMAGRNVSDFWLYLRPAGWSVGYVFARDPRMSVSFDAAPILAIPMSGQPWAVSFSSFVIFEASMS